MRIQYASDLHLELWTKVTFDETLEPVAPYLVLCGDVAKLNAPNLRQFLEYCSERWKLIFWIPGNEEIWSYSNLEDYSLQKMREISSPYRNIKILYKDTFLLEENDEKLLLVGLSLWHKPRNDVMLHYHNNIFIKPIPTICTPQIFRNAHEENLRFLNTIVTNAKLPLLICSYYPPFTWLYEEDWIQEPNSALIDRELEKLITYPIITWIIGHNHLPVEYNRRYYTPIGYQGSVLFVSNPRGKPKGESYYRREAVIRLAPNMLEGFESQEKEEVPIWVTKNHLTT
jgi:hypothetical protein